MARPIPLAPGGHDARTVHFNDASIERVRNTVQGKCVLLLPTAGPAPVRELIASHGLGCLCVMVDGAPRGVLCFGSRERVVQVRSLALRSDVLDYTPTLVEGRSGESWDPREVLTLLDAERLEEGVVMFTTGSSFFARRARDF